MSALLLAMLLLQGNSVQTGVATGTVRSANGTPAAGVRVFAIPAGDPNAASNGPVVFESLAQTDAAGRYRLEVPAGRYYIGAGSVNSPTYFPDSSSIAAAKAISIAAGTMVESIDFSRFTAAPLSPTGVIVFQPPQLPPGSTGVLSGVIRSYDGAVAPGIAVTAFPVSAGSGPATSSTSLGGLNAFISGSVFSAGNVTIRFANGGRQATTDSLGRYRLESLSPDTYNIVAGFADSPVYLPGTYDSQKASAITTTPTTLLTTLDFTLPPPPKFYSVRGRVTAMDSKLAGGVNMDLRNAGVGTVQFLPRRTYPLVLTAADGTFEIPDVAPGKYTLQAHWYGGTPLSKAIEVTDRSVNVDFDIMTHVLTGRVVWDDGSVFQDPSVGEVAISTTSNPNFVATTLLKLSRDGSFSGVIDPGEYRFYVRSLPDIYEIRSITAGPVDLTKEHLVIRSEAPSDIEIRVSKRSANGTRIRGKVVDAISRSPSQAERIELCCFTSSPFESLSATLQPDGSFDFPGVPPGRYSAELRKGLIPATAAIVNRTVDIGEQEISDLLLLSATPMLPLTISFSFDDFKNRPPLDKLSLSMTISSVLIKGEVEVAVPLSRLSDTMFWAQIPSGVRYTVSVANLPEGYRLRNPDQSPGGMPDNRFSSTVIGTVRIVIEKIPGQ